MKLLIAVGILITLTSASSVYALTDSSPAAIEIEAADHSCAEISQAIQRYGKVFVRMGFGGRSFRYPPYSCNRGDKRTTVHFWASGGESCTLGYACMIDSTSPIHRD